MRYLSRFVLCASFAGAGFLIAADDVKPAVPLVKAKKADDKQPEKKLTEEEQAELEYKKYLEAQAKALEGMEKLATHKVSAEIKVTGEGGKGTLQTLTFTPDSKVLALVGPPRGYGAPMKGATAEVQVFDAAGKKTGTWKVPFHAHSINAAPDGTVYVAGDGKVLVFDQDGKAKGDVMEMPHITELFKDKDSLRKKAEETLVAEKKQREESLKNAKEQFEKTIKKIEEIKEEDRTKAQTRQLQQAKSILESYKQMEQQDSKRTVEDVIQSMTGRVRIINGIAVSEKDVFVACGETAGYGYTVWRFDRDLKNPTQIIKGLGGCCGQMDVQVSGTDLIVAENTKKQFGRYDRDGKRIAGFGKASNGTDADPAGFGGCCNPMNTRCAAGTGDIFTSESEGIIKQFSSTGAFIGVAGTVKISGGCKNVAIGVSGKGDTIVFCDQPGSRFFILAKKTDSK